MEAASVRVEAPSLTRMFDTWVLVVFVAILEGLADLAVGAAFGDELEHLRLARGQHGARRRSRRLGRPVAVRHKRLESLAKRPHCPVDSRSRGLGSRAR